MSVPIKQEQPQPHKSLFPLPSQWVKEFKENWYKDNNILPKKQLDGLWEEMVRTFDMIYKYQRKAFEKNQSQEQPKQEAIEDIDLRKFAYEQFKKEGWLNPSEAAIDYFIEGYKAALLSKQNHNAEKQIAEKIAGYVHEIDSLHISKRELWQNLSADKLILVEKIAEQEIEIASLKNNVKDCSEHKKEVAGISDMKVLAEMIGDLNYETLATLLASLSNKMAEDSHKDLDNDKVNLAGCLAQASDHIAQAFLEIEEAWQISKPFMEPENLSEITEIQSNENHES